jgi:hypothetical protein
VAGYFDRLMEKAPGQYFNLEIHIFSFDLVICIISKTKVVALQLL